MKDTLTVTGIVLSAMPVGEYDKRLLLLTRDLGKISAFARGSRRPNSPLMGATRLFAFGEFELFEGRSAYTVRAARIAELFDYLSTDLEAMCFGSYFAEIADYYSHENVDGSKLIKLLYIALLAMKSDKLDRRLIRRVYELKAMQGEGEYFEQPRTACGEAASYAWSYVLSSPPEKVFRFGLESLALEEFSRAVQNMKEYFIDRSFRSLRVLEEMEGPGPEASE